MAGRNLFLSYLNDWDEWVQGNEKVPKGAKKCCTLPDQTIEGLKICDEQLQLLDEFCIMVFFHNM